MEKLLLDNSIINQFIQVIPITLLFGIFYIVIRIIYIKKKNLKINYKSEILYLIFICYVIGLFNLTLVPINFWSRIWHLIFYGFGDNPFNVNFEFSYNFIPTLYKVIIGEYLLGSWVITMIIGNV